MRSSVSPLPPSPSESPIALVLGATGGIGGALARRLAADGWTVRAFHRRPSSPQPYPGLTWIRGDALVSESVAVAARGARLIVHAVNPPGYRHWDRLVLPMLDNTLHAARSERAQVLLPGTLYNYDPTNAARRGPLDEDAPQDATTVKGHLRIEMERRLRQATEDGAMRALVVRAGDYFGPGAGNSWFSQALVSPGRPVTRVRPPGPPGVGHQWAYLPDMAQIMTQLVSALPADRPPFEAFHTAGYWDEDGRQLIAAIARVTGRQPRKAAFPWGLIRLAAPVVPLFRELQEIRPFWQAPVRMDNTRLEGRLGHAEPRTPLDSAIREALISLGCLAFRAPDRPQGQRPTAS